MTKQVNNVVLASPLTLETAKTLMWAHYKANKALLIDEIKESREQILMDLMSGKSVVDVFAKFIQPPEPRSAKRKVKSP
jgi:hypothetical protein